VPRGSLLIGDLGGTNARFALAQPDGQGYQHELSLECRAHASAERAIEAYLKQVGAPAPTAICLAVAGPFEAERIRFLNSNWSLDAAKLRIRFQGARIRLVNDFQAVAHAIPMLRPEDLLPVGRLRPRLPETGDFTVGVLGPGTGLGVSGLIRAGGKTHALSSEGGHHGFAPETPLQIRVLEQLRERFERVSDERLLSGPGIENIHRALQAIHGVAAVERDAADIFRRARDGGDDFASQTERLFFEVLGQVAGNLALTLGAREGVYIAGGIIRRYPGRIEAGPFRSGFENKGRHRALMEAIPTCLITHPQPGLLGASQLVRTDQAA